jgi:hypothetical protein
LLERSLITAVACHNGIAAIWLTPQEQLYGLPHGIAQINIHRCSRRESHPGENPPPARIMDIPYPLAILALQRIVLEFHSRSKSFRIFLINLGHGKCKTLKIK